MRIALAGNPNSGKTTMYNALTGNYERVGNVLAECEYFTVEELVVDGMTEIKVTER